MSEVVISVRGFSERQVAPEEAVASITVRAEGPDRGAVVEQLATRSTPVRDDLAARAEAGSIVTWTSRRVSVWSERPWNTEGKQLGIVHRASVDMSATFTDVAALSWWLGEVAERDGVDIRTVDWRLSRDTAVRVEREVATEAVAAALARATAYADALGLGSVTPIQVADVGLLDEHATHAHEMFRAAATALTGSAPDLELRPEDIVVTVGVDARFTAR